MLQLPLADDPPAPAETLRYGHYSLAGEFVYDHPFQWGSKRTGPDLARVGGKYSDEWHRVHLNNPRDVVPESNMPAYAWLERSPVDAAGMPVRPRPCAPSACPTPTRRSTAKAVAGKGPRPTPCVVAYLQVLGTAVK